MARRRSASAWRRPISWVAAAAAIVGLIVLQATRSPAGAGVVGRPSATSVTAADAGAASDPSAADPVPSADGPSPTVPPLSAPPQPAPPSPSGGRFGLGVLIADRGNGRLIVVDDAKRILWQFPVRGSLPKGQQFSADDAFLAPDGRTIVANDEAHQVIDRIDITTRRVIWQYGHYGRAGSATGYLHTPDDAYPLANGDITVADIRNCRILEISPGKRIVRHWGHAGSCSHQPPASFNNPNGDTPLPDGGLLITEIGGSRVVRLSRTGQVVFDIHVPVRYPSDAQLDPSGNVLVVDYSNPGAILRVSPRGHVLWRYGPRAGPGRLDHPSLAILLPDGMIALNDDFRDRVVVIDPKTSRIVWQYGRTDRNGRRPGYLSAPDGIDVIPVGTRLS
jgi:putative pyrroloquinoline-quinone binding quinoprotein